MPQNYVPIFIFIAFVGILIPVTLLAAKLVRPDNPSKSKLMPYEYGIDPVDSSRGRYTVRYYIVAILFVVFDVETIFLFPWAVQFKALGVFGLIEMLIFLLIMVTPQHVSRLKSRLFGSSEESIALGKVASVQISTGVIWSEIRIDSSGGTAPITSHGHRKADALRIRELIESYQAEQGK